MKKLLLNQVERMCAKLSETDCFTALGKQLRMHGQRQGEENCTIGWNIEWADGQR